MTRGVLRTRLLPPRPPPGCLVREELLGRVLRGLEGRLVTMMAGAGYGKTTLLAQTVARLECPWVWVSCDARLAHPGPLLAHLAAGLEERFPGFGAALEFRGPVEDQVAALCNEIVATVSEDFVMVLDDVHALAADGDQALGLLANDLPPQVHLALAGRRPAPFSLGRLRAGGVTEVGPGDLVLSPREAGAIMRAAGCEVDEATLADVHRRTEGWVTGLILASQVGPGSIRPSEGGSFEYLAEEVLLGQEPVVQDFLVRTSVLERFTPELAEAVTGEPSAARLCRELVARHLFTFRLETEGAWFRYHYLFHRFLQQRLRESGHDLVAELHRRAAEGWSQAGEPVEAVRHYLEAGEHQRAVDALEPVAEHMATSPDADQLARWLDSLPRDIWAERPTLRLVEGTLLFADGRYEAAFGALESAIDRLIASGDGRRAGIACFRLLEAMTSAGVDPERGIAVGERYLSRLDPETAMLPASRIILAGRYGFAGRYAEAERELRRAAALPTAAGMPSLPAYSALTRAYFIDHPQGRSRAALAELDTAIAALTGPGPGDPLAYLVWAHAFRGLILNALGRHEEALAEADRTMGAAARRGNVRFVEPVVALARLSALMGLERWPELELQLRGSAVQLQGRAFSTFGPAYQAVAACLAAWRGETAEMRAQVASAREIARSIRYPYQEAQILCDLFRAAWMGGAMELARELAADAGRMATVARAPWLLARAALLGAAAWKGEPEGRELLGQALDVTARCGYAELWTLKERALAAPLLTWALVKGIGSPRQAARLAVTSGGDVLAEVAERIAEAPAAVRAELAEVAGETLGVEAEIMERLLRDGDSRVRRAALRSRKRIAGRPRPPLQILSLGGFGVRRGERFVPASAFGRQRARALLAALLCAGRPVHREELLEWFWPELSVDRGRRALHVTVHGLRRALEPDLPRGAAESVIRADGETYRVCLGPEDGWDAEAFLRLAKAAGQPHDQGQRLAALRAAASAYTGSLFPEWPYAEWTQARRAEVESAHREVLDRLADGLSGAGRATEAIACYLELLRLEPEREASHRALMSAYERAGERALALRQYHACRKIMRTELGVEPSAETRALYQAILARPEVARGSR